MKKLILTFYTILFCLILFFNLLPELNRENNQTIKNKELYKTIRVFKKGKNTQELIKYRNRVDSLWDNDKEELIKMLEEVRSNQ